MTHQALAERATDLLREGQSEQAAALYTQIPEGVRTPSVWSNLGLAQQMMGMPLDALRSLNQALVQAPEFADAWYNYGVTLNHLGRNHEAKHAYERVLTISPHHTNARLNLGICLYATGDCEGARQTLALVLDQNPSIQLAWYWLGKVLLELDDWPSAQNSFIRAVDLCPNDREALIGLGNAQLVGGLHAQALQAFELAEPLGPDRFDLSYFKGNALRELGRFPEAIMSYQRALSIQPESIEALANLGVCHESLHDFSNALQCYERLLAVQPNHPVGLFNSANALGDLGYLKEAVERYGVLESIEHTIQGAKLNLAICLLKLGDYERGWPLYEERWAKPHPADVHHFDQPLWLGATSLAGKRVLLLNEQGLGDTLQFCRYARQVKSLGAHVILRAQDALLPLLTGLQGVDELVGTSAQIPAFDTYCPLLSLPLAFKTDLNTVDGRTPYLWADAARIEKWQGILGPRTKARVGLAWQGAKGYRFDFRRSMPLSALTPLFDLAQRYEFVVLQKDLSQEDKKILSHHPYVRVLPEQADFGDAAALVASLDLVITVDTAVGHLSGALGQCTWILLPTVADWRWVVHQNRSPWYPSTQLFWQSQTDDWSGPVMAAVNALVNWPIS